MMKHSPLPNRCGRLLSPRVNSLSRMLIALAQGNVEFVLVGGYAAVTHGVTLVTQDVDICCRFSPENLFRLQAVLAEFHPRHRMTPQRLPLELTEELCAHLKNLYLETDLCVLDCLGEVKGVGGFDSVLAHSIQISLPGGTFRVLDLATLIEAKEAMNRPHDRLALTQLRAIQEQKG
jgi:hypothetical protein